MFSRYIVLEDVKESTRTINIFDDNPNFVINLITMVHQTDNTNDFDFHEGNHNDNYIDTAIFITIQAS